MVHRIIPPATLLLALLAGCAGPEPPAPDIAWAPSLPLGLEAAVEADKRLFVFFHAPWCGICARMKAEVLADPAVREALERYVPVAIDVERDPHLARKYQVPAVPIFLILGEGGQAEARAIGEMDTRRMLAFLGAGE